MCKSKSEEKNFSCFDLNHVTSTLGHVQSKENSYELLPPQWYMWRESTMLNGSCIIYCAKS